VAPATRLVTIPAAAVRATAAASGTADPGQATPFPLSHLAARWTGDEDAVVEIRWGTRAGWQPWQVAPVSYDISEGAGGQVFSSLVRADGADRIEGRAVRGRVDGLQLVAIDTTHAQRKVVRAKQATASADVLPTTSTTSTTTPAANKGRVTQPPVVTRSEWGADESMRKNAPDFAPINKLIVHHTDTQNDDPDPAATVRAIYAYHTQSRGWDDIGYNFLIDEAGRIYEGRWARQYDPGEVPTGEDRDGNGVIGAHALNANTGSVGIALLGNFDNQLPTAAARKALDDLLAFKADIHQIDPMGATPFAFGDGSTKTFPNISGHRDTYQTDCPGGETYDQLPAIRQEVDSRIGSAHGATRGYWVATRDGGVHTFGSAQFYGSMGGTKLNAPIVGMAPTPAGTGYWLLGRDGGIFAFGGAGFFGSTGNLKLNQPVVALQPTPSGRGYWLVAKDGGIFSFGDARFFGSTGNMVLNQPVDGMAATPSGQGYWLVAADGGIFSFGDATFHGSTGNIKLNSPVIAMATAFLPNNKTGYWLVARDGGIFAFDAPYKGSVPGLNLPSYAGSVDMKPSVTANGYYVLGADGGIFTFGDANFLGAQSGVAAAAMAVLPGASTTK
jgi:hypothetical protein